MLDPKITNRRICLLQQDVPPCLLMTHFDLLPSRVRQAIADSPFQLCVSCILQAYTRDIYDPHNEERALTKIRQMEEEARALQN